MKIKKLLKIAFSLLISFILLNGICFFYYNVPVHSESKTGSTDYIWEKSKFYSRGTEGFAWGRTDGNGFNNISTDNSVSPDVLIMGTSHTEAFNVQQNESYAYLLNKFAADSGIDASVYNIGISGHRIITCLNNYEEALEEFKPHKYVIIEATTTELSIDDIDQIVNGTVKKNHSTANPVLIFLQKIPLVRCVYYQLDKLGVEIKNTTDDESQVQTTKNSDGETTKTENYNDALDSLFKQIAGISEKNGIKLIVLFNSPLEIDDNGVVLPQEKSEESYAFENACKKNGIIFLNMYDAFAANYNATYRLPNGFSNTAVGEGHLNKYGHEVIAKELYKLIESLENNKSV